MTSQPQRDTLRRFYIAYGIIAILCYLFLMVVAFPWWQASNHPVTLTLGANDDTRISLGYSSREEALPLIATGERTPFHWTWTTELPPRPRYELFLEFPNGTDGETILKEVAILDLHSKTSKVLLDLTGLEDQSGNSVRIRKLGDGWGILARQGGRINLPSDFTKHPVSGWFKDWVRATWGFLLMTGVGMLVLATALRFPNGIEPRKRIVPYLETALLLTSVIAGAAVHMYLLRHALPGYELGESTAYLMDALVSGPALSQSVDAFQFFVNPLPVYPLFLGFALQLFEGNLNTLILLQGSLYCVAVLLLALSFRRLVHGYLIGIVAFLILLSPATVWTSRQIQHSSLFSTCWILAIAAFIFLWQRSGSARLAGWMLFGLAATCAACIHPSGLLLLILPVFLLVGALWWSYSNRGSRFWKIPTLWITVGQVAIPLTMVIGISYSIAWMDSLGSPAHGVNGYVETQRANSPFNAGYFDARAPGNGQKYDGLISVRAKSGYAFNGWDLRQFYLNSIKEQGELPPQELIAELNLDLVDFNHSIGETVPLQARLAAMGRVAGWAFSSPKLNSYSLEPISPSYVVVNSFSTMESEQEIRRKLSLVASGTSLPLRLTKAFSDPWVVLYNRSLVVVYPWVYRILFLFSVVAWMLAVSERKYLASALIMPFIFLVAYHIFQIHVLGNELQTFDAVLWMAVLCGFTSVSRNTLQTETAEDDRRCLPPVKPKRLLTRHAHNPDSLL